MDKRLYFMMIAVMILLLLPACEQPVETDPDITGNPDTTGPDEEQITMEFSFPCGTIKMIYCPGGSFLINDNDGDLDFEDGPEVTCDPFWISETEVRNEFLAWIYESASESFNFSESTAHNYCCEYYARWGDQDLIYMGEPPGDEMDIIHTLGFTVRSGLDNYPCTDITWYGAVMACNWLTQEASELGPSEVVYSGIGENWEDDETVCDFTRTGFRLPTAVEWECAARRQGKNNSGNTYAWPTGSGNYWTCGGCASGASDTTDNVDATAAVAVYEYDGEGFTNPEDREEVIGTRNPNALGLYDMSGNVWEWCFDEDAGGYSRIARGGSAQSKYNDIRIASRAIMGASGTGSDLGFRLVMSAE